MNAREYYAALQASLSNTLHVVRSEMAFDEVDVNECYVRGVLNFAGGFNLHIAEYVITHPAVMRPKYRYHLQDPTGAMVARWDNAPHHTQIPTHPYHFHDTSETVRPSAPMDIPQVLDAVLPLIGLIDSVDHESGS